MAEGLNNATLLVKRYANRKIYVPEDKAYTNFRGLYDIICGGRDIRVTCVSSGRDVTAQVLGMVYQQMVVELGAVSPTTLLMRLRQDKPPSLSA